MTNPALQAVGTAAVSLDRTRADYTGFWHYNGILPMAFSTMALSVGSIVS